ncbi:MAG: flagellar filament capping protein FliD [Vulcanimicrobiaceae bacterium]
MSTSNIPGTNIPPISFPGIVSGIDYNSIIQKLTSATLYPTISLNQQIATLNQANLALVNINGLLASVQTTLQNLSNVSLFDSYNALSSNTSVATAQGIPSVVATPGVYTIDSVQTATSTTIVSNAGAGHNINDNIDSPGVSSATVPLVDSYAAITPANGSTGLGKVTVDGVQVSYDVTSQSLDTILSNIQTAVQAVDPGFTASVNAGGVVTFASTDKPISLGSASDSGNLLDVLKLTNAQVVNTPTSGQVVGTSDVGGINQALAFNSTNATGYATNANFVTAVTSGSFTINGVAISVNAATDNTASVIARINAANAGVLAGYDATTNQVTLTATQSGPQSIVLGSSGDTSNFLSAVGLTGPGATTTIGQQAQILLQTPSGGTQTIYSNSNQVTTAIPGIQINLLSNTTHPFTIAVSQDSSQLVNAATAFVSAYNAAVSEINTVTAAPLIPPSPSGALGAPPVQPIGGGLLYGNTELNLVQNQLTNIVGGFLGDQTTGYNSLSQIGVKLTSTMSQLTTSNNTGQNSTGSNAPPVSVTQLQGSDGTLQPLNASALVAALQANPTAVQSLLTGPNGLASQLGGYLTGVTGIPTILPSGVVGQIPSVSILQNDENTLASQIASIQQQVQNIKDVANAQADQLRSEFVNTEAQLSQYQALQQQLSGFFKQSGSS